MKKVAEIILILFVATICGFYSKEYYDNVKAAKLFTNDYSKILDSETTLVMLYFGCSTCGYSNEEDVLESVALIANTLKNTADSIDIPFQSIGVSREFNINEGINHLLKTNVFNEISIGNSWHNSTLNRYVWDKGILKPSTPQLVILRRKYTTNKIDNEIVSIGEILSEEILFSSTGNTKIVSMADNILLIVEGIIKVF
jgi:hypothetical protein